jgi:hypothetical protein
LLIFFTFCFFFFSLFIVVNMFIKEEWGELCLQLVSRHN